MRQRFLLLIGILCCLALALQAQDVPSWVQLNRLAKQSAAGDANATSALVDTAFSAAGVDPAEIKGTGAKERLLQAELNFQKGAHPSIPEANIAATVNSVAKKLNAPDFAYTNTPQVRQLRVRLMVLSPNLATLSATGGLSDQLRPVEAFYVTAMMLRQKIYNPEFQLSPRERSQRWNQLHGTRTSAPVKPANDGARVKQLVTAVGSNGSQDPKQLIHNALDVLGVARQGGVQ